MILYTYRSLAVEVLEIPQKKRQDTLTVKKRGTSYENVQLTETYNRERRNREL